MTPRNIRQADLNLLIALDVMLEERNVTRSAERLGLTQSAASRMLGRLRNTFDDPLLVRTSRGLTPTRRALELAGPLREHLAGLEKVLLEGAEFDPRSASRRFCIAANDYVQAILLAPLVAKLQRQAPRVDFEIRQPTADSERELDAGVLDLLLTPQRRLGPSIVWTPLYREEYICLVAKDHPVKRLTLAHFAAMEHILVAPRERAGGIVDAVLKEHGLERRVAVQASTFLILPSLLIGTTRIATVPARMAECLARSYPLRTLQAPIEIPGFVISQGWHEIHRNDPSHRWLRDMLVAAVKNQ